MKKVENSTYDEDGGHNIITKAKVYYRALVCYPFAYPCRIKGCAHKKRNGRCGLREIRLELDEKGNQTGVCSCFKKKV